MKLSTSNGLAAGSIDVTAVACTPPKIVDASVEHAVVIIKNGNIYHCNGDVHGIPKVYFDNMASELESAHITHNHPIGVDENEHTFLDKSHGRVIGILIDAVFYIVWLDPHHNPTDSKGYGGANKFKRPCSDYEKLFQRATELEKKMLL